MDSSPSERDGCRLQLIQALVQQGHSAPERDNRSVAGSRASTPGLVAARIAVIFVCALVVIGCVAEHAGQSAGLGVFNACIGHSQFLTLARDRSGSKVLEVIDDRARDAKVAEVTSGRDAGTLGGAAAGNDRFTMSTATPLGRDASAIERCWDRYSPIASDS